MLVYLKLNDSIPKYGDQLYLEAYLNRIPASKNPYSFYLPNDVAKELASNVRALRLQRSWKQATLAENAGVTLASLRRFEQTGKVSLETFLNLVFALQGLDVFKGLLHTDRPASLKELEELSRIKKNPQRGRL